MKTIVDRHPASFFRSTKAASRRQVGLIAFDHAGNALRITDIRDIILLVKYERKLTCAN